MPKKRGAASDDAEHWCFAWVPKVPKKSKAVVLKEAIWSKEERVIPVGFLDGPTKLRQAVADAAQGWCGPGLANVKFVFMKDASKCRIRITFAFPGAWSLLGTWCKSKGPSEPTMNLGKIKQDSSLIQRTVLHEFGHALGLTHEHQNPRNTIPWRKDVIYKELSGPPNKWDKKTIDANMFDMFPKKAVIASKADKTSIMMYPFPSRWTLDGSSTQLNTMLSVKDRQFIRAIYP